MTELNPIPPKVATAICAVMKDVPKLAKTERNEHGKYDFASIDTFLEAIRPLCAKHGLIILPDETETGMLEGTDQYGKPTRALSMIYEFTICHSSGETWNHRPKRSIAINAKMGSQAYGAGQSYALKNFMRALFQVATGEPDLDAYDQQDPSTRTDGPDEVVPGQLGKMKLQAQLREFDHQMHACTDLGEFEGLVYSYDAALKQAERDLPSWMKTKQGSDTLGMIDRIANKRKELTEPDDSGDDKVPF